MSSSPNGTPVIRDVAPTDLDALQELEERSFSTDRLSRRSFQRWIHGEKRSIFRVLEYEAELRGYGLVLLHKGTHLARLYSIVLHPLMQGKGIGKKLLEDLENQALARGRFFMRLEVGKKNLPAIRLYEGMGYRVFGEYPHYYEDNSDALRMQKRIRNPGPDRKEAHVPWYQQTTPFTCGPAALMMAMASLHPELELNQRLELDLWREATTIYMTSGHGGCHPLGLCLAAKRRGFETTVVMSQLTTPFTEGVRVPHKKEILKVVHKQFMDSCQRENIKIIKENVTAELIESWLNKGCPVLVLISSYRMNGDKAPHWVVVTGSDDICFYVHDPDIQSITDSELDCQHIPVAKDNFSKMVSYGNNRFSTALCLSITHQNY